MAALLTLLALAFIYGFLEKLNKRLTKSEAGRAAKEGPICQIVPMDPALAELKKQTRIMADKEAGKSATGGFIVGIPIGLAAFFFMANHVPDWIAITALFGSPFLCAILGYRTTKRDYI